jgi:16S rRNA (cytosine967-C5)-methyltransferase
VRAVTATGLRRLGQIEHLLARFLAKPLPAKSGHARDILIVAAAQILFMRVPAHAAIDVPWRSREATATRATLPGSSMPCCAGWPRPGSMPRPTAPRSISTPRPGCGGAGARNYGEDTARAIAERHAEDPPLDITVKADRQGWAETLGGEVLPTGTVRIAAQGPDRGAAGLRFGRLVGAGRRRRPAGAPDRQPGGAASPRPVRRARRQDGPAGRRRRPRHRARPVAEGRLERLKENLARLHLTADIVVADAARFQSPEPYDAVLLDAPCTATGIVAPQPRHPPPQVRIRSRPAAALQAACSTTRFNSSGPGGLVVYCTCSLEPEEGVEQVAGAAWRDPRHRPRADRALRDRRRRSPDHAGGRSQHAAHHLGTPASTDSSPRACGGGNSPAIVYSPLTGGVNNARFTAARSKFTATFNGSNADSRRGLGPGRMAGAGEARRKRTRGLGLAAAQGLGALHAGVPGRRPRPAGAAAGGRQPRCCREIYRGRFRFADTTIDAGGRSIFDHTAAPAAWLQELHGFSWLADLQRQRPRTVPGPEPLAGARVDHRPQAPSQGWRSPPASPAAA